MQLFILLCGLLKNNYLKTIIMKKILLLLTLAFVTGSFYAQQNMNPDPNGDPWIAGELRPLTEADWKMLDNTHKLSYDDFSFRNDLPDRVDNTEQPYFRPVFSQEGGSCGQASGIGYCFTYEINRLRDLPANQLENQYPTHFTWNFLNGGYGGGSWHFDGYQIVKANGCPNVVDYGGHFAYGGEARWMSGYPEYYNGMHNRVYEIMAIDVSTEEGINTLKQWMYDHLDGSETGGIANFAGGVSNTFNVELIEPGNPHAGECIITWWDSQVNHAMTFAGYDDNIMWDFNGDGQYTNDIDINNDGVVDPKDWEIGAVIMVNSWGTFWCDAGKAYVPYKLLAQDQDNGGIWNTLVHVINVKEECDPMITLEAKIQHTSRNKLRITAGVADNPDATKPDHVMQFPLFNYQGGDQFMQGGTTTGNDTLELGFDITPILSEVTNNTEAKFFLYIIERDDDNVGSGEIVSFSVHDYVQDEEVVYPDEHIALNENDTTFLGVVKEVNFNRPQISTENLPDATYNQNYAQQLEAEEGLPPYKWSIVIEYDQETGSSAFPEINDVQLSPSSNDDGYAIQEIDFDFPFYGESFNEITVLTDGSLTFGNTFTYIRSISNLKYRKAITPYGSDLMIYPEQNDGIFYEGDETYAAFKWKTSKYNNPGFDVESAVIIYPDGKIEFYYGEITEDINWASGVSKGDGQSYTIADYSGMQSLDENFMAEFTGGDFPMGMGITEEGSFEGLPLSQGSYTITFVVTDFNNIYTKKDIDFDVVTHVDIADNKARELEIYPNPAKDHVYISFPDINIPEAQINLLGISGKLVKYYETDLENRTLQRIELTNDNNHSLKPGIYFISIKSGNTNLTRKIIIY